MNKSMVEMKYESLEEAIISVLKNRMGQGIEKRA